MVLQNRYRKIVFANVEKEVLHEFCMIFPAQVKYTYTRTFFMRSLSILFFFEIAQSRPSIFIDSKATSKFPRYNTKCRGK